MNFDDTHPTSRSSLPDHRSTPSRPGRAEQQRHRPASTKPREWDSARQSTSPSPSPSPSPSDTRVGERVSPNVQALVDALEGLDGLKSRDVTSTGEQPWGIAGLGADCATKADVETLARLHHRLTAQIGLMIRGSVTTIQPSQPDASSLVSYDSPPSESSPDPGAKRAGGAETEAKRTGATELEPGPGGSTISPGNESDPQHSRTDGSTAADHISTRGDEPPEGETPGADTDFSRPSQPFGGQTTLVGRGWSPGQARTVISAARFCVNYPAIEQLWRAGDISAETVLELQRTCRKLTGEQAIDFIAIMADHLADLAYRDIRRLIAKVLDLVRPDSIDKDEKDAYQSRSLSFSHYKDSVLFQGQLPKLEGQLFHDTIMAIAEKQRTQGDLIRRGQRNADALTELLANSATSGQTPSLGGLPVAITITSNLPHSETVAAGRPPAHRSDHPSGCDAEHAHGRTFSLYHDATYPDGDLVADATTRFALCCADITPIWTVKTSAGQTGSASEAGEADGDPSGAITEPGRPTIQSGSLLQRLLTTTQLPLAVGRTQRLATTAQRKALALRDGGCVIPGCDISPNRTQPHHVTDYSLGGLTELDNLASLCWVHHRQVELEHWTLVRNPEPDKGPYWNAKLKLR